MSFDCQPAPITQRVWWTPVCRIQTNLKVIWLFHHFISWNDWQPVDWAPKYHTQKQMQVALNADTPATSFKTDLFYVFVLLGNLLSYFPVQSCKLTVKEMPLKLVLSKGQWWWKPWSCSPSLIQPPLYHSWHNSFYAFYFWNCAQRNTEGCLQGWHSHQQSSGVSPDHMDWGLYCFLGQKNEVEH